MRPKTIIPIEKARDATAAGPTHVTRTFLPSLEDFQVLLREIWDSHQITNRGPLVERLENRLGQLLGAQNLLCVANGTLALQLAIRALRLTGEVITTPFTYVATSSALLWERCEPVYVDIEPEHLCLDPDRIEAAITPRTSAILATHIFGNPCDVHRIEAIAEAHGIPVIFDAAHAFGVSYAGRPLVSWGDISTLSFHATKIFHTVEGGALVFGNAELGERLGLMHAFGHRGDVHLMPGINAKMSELHAAMGLALLSQLPEIFRLRQRIHDGYEHAFQACSGVRRPQLREGASRSYAYYPIIFDSEAALLRALALLAAEDIHPRRYFYPSLNTLPYVNGAACPVSEDIARRIACLPMGWDLQPEQQARVVALVEKAAEPAC